MTDSSESRDTLLQANMDLFARLLSPQVHSQIATASDRDRLSGSLAGGDLNLLRDGKALRHPNAVVVAAKAVEVWRRDPVRLYAPAPQTGPPHDAWAHGRATLTMRAALQDADLAATPDEAAGHLILLGVGLGLEALMLGQQVRARSLIVIEPDLGLLRASAHVVDWTALAQLAAARGGAVHLIVGQTPQAAAAECVHALRDQNYPRFDGAYYFENTTADYAEAFREAFASGIVAHAYSMACVEDERRMLANAAANLKRYAHKAFPTGVAAAQPVPALVVGSGPSLDAALPKIRETATRSVIFSGGTGVGALLAHGVTPDFHCEFENTPEIVDIVRASDPEDKLRNCVLIAPTTIDPDLAAHFGSVIFFHRDSVTPTRLYAEQGAPPELVGPTVTNTAFRAAIAFGFPEIVFFGVDLGSAQGADHHAQSSIYLRDNRGRSLDPGNPHDLKVEGNHTPFVRTNREFLYARMFFEKLISLCGQQRIYNAGDGAMIAGAQPVRPHQFNPPAPPRPKQRIVADLLAGLEARAAGELGGDAALSDFVSAVGDWVDAATMRIGGPDGAPAPVDRLIDALAPMLLKGQLDLAHGRDAAVRAFLSGTIFEALKAAWYYERRLPHERLPAFRRARDAALRNALEEIRPVSAADLLL
ncbi:MAG: DUF115 domain-containing protein [Alphaproteobacteria bacterium]|nr:DUF115 domain-containing protein [Alphaproteobacteria bacterium]